MYAMEYNFDIKQNPRHYISFSIINAPEGVIFLPKLYAR